MIRKTGLHRDWVEQRINESAPDYYGDIKHHQFWIGWDNLNKTSLSSAIITQNMAYMSFTHVVPEYRGQGLQLKHLSVRERWARRRGVEGCITYTRPWNCWSGNNLIKAGYVLYQPEDPWVGEDMVYWMKELK